MWVYYNELGNVSTRIAHGKTVRQHENLDLYLCFDPAFFGKSNNEQLYNYLVNDSVRMVVQFKKPSQKEFGETAYISTNDITIERFIKTSTSEVTYDFVNGKRYVVVHYHSSSNLLNEFGNYECLVTIYDTSEQSINIDGELVDGVKRAGVCNIYVDKTYGKNLPNTHITPSQYDFLLSSIGGKMDSDEYDIYTLSESESIEQLVFSAIEAKKNHQNKSYIYLGKLHLQETKSDCVILLSYEESLQENNTIYYATVYNSTLNVIQRFVYNSNENSFGEIQIKFKDLTVDNVKVNNNIEVPTPKNIKDAVNKQYADENYVGVFNPQTITGVKTFNNPIYVNSSTPYLISKLPNKVGIRANDSKGITAGQFAITDSIVENEGNTARIIAKGDDGLYYGIEVSKKGLYHIFPEGNKEISTKEYVDDSIANIDFPKTDLSGYYTKDEVDSLVDLIQILEILKVDKLPTSNISSRTIYLVPSSKADDENFYDEFIYINGSWEQIGSTKVDLTNYYTKEEVANTFATLANLENINKSTFKVVKILGGPKSITVKDVAETINTVTEDESCYLVLTGYYNFAGLVSVQNKGGIYFVVMYDFTNNGLVADYFSGDTVIDDVIAKVRPNLTSLTGVDISSDQIISGVKTFSNGIGIGSSKILVDSSNSINITYNDETRVKIGNAETSFVARVSPSQNDTYDLGRSTLKWKDLYLSGKITDGTNEIQVSNIANKEELDSKLDRNTTSYSTPIVYARGADGMSEDRVVQYHSNAYGQFLIQRDANGMFYINEPTEGTHPASKNYVDNKLSVESLIDSIGKASQTLDGLMSKEDKTNLDTLVLLLGEDENTTVDKINEILAIFNQYPEGADLISALALKADKTDLDLKQNTLVSGTNIKTINNESLLGEGNITLDSKISSEALTTVAVGGIKKGESLKGKSVVEVLENIFFPYVAFSMGGLSTSPGASTVYEKGYEATLNSVTQAITLGSKPLYSIKLYIGGTLVAEKTSGLSTSNTFSGLAKKISSTTTIKTEATDGTNTLTKTLNVFKFVSPFYYGILDTNGTPSSSDITSKTKDVKDTGNKTYTYTCTAKFPFIAYPKSYGELTNILDGNGFENLTDFTAHTITINNVSYYVYIKNSAATVSNFSYTFKGC